MSVARLKETLFGVYRERSEPPNVRLPKTPFESTSCQLSL